MKKVLTSLFLTSLLFASSEQTDIFERSINFLVFACLLTFLIKGKIQEFLHSRHIQIATTFEEIKKDLTNLNLEKQKAQNDIENAYNEIILYENNLEKDLESLEIYLQTQLAKEKIKLEKQYENLKSYEEKRVLRSTVAQFLEENIDHSSIKIDAKALSYRL